MTMTTNANAQKPNGQQAQANGQQGAQEPPKKKPPSKSDLLKQFLESHRGKLAESIPSSLFSVDDFIRTFFYAVQQQPKLLDCTRQSLWYSLSQAAQLGLKIGTPLGFAHLRPTKNKQTQEQEAKLIIGYRGYIELARRSGQIASVQARCIMEGDIYDIDYARVECPIRHKVDLSSPIANPKILGAYCLTLLKDNPYPIPEVMTKAQIDKIKRKYASGSGAVWDDNPDEMARKTVIRRAQKYWPLSEALVVAERVARENDVSVEMDDPVDTGADEFGTDADGRTITADGEIIEEAKAGQEVAAPGRGVAGARARAQAQALPQATTTPAQAGPQADPQTADVNFPTDEELARLAAEKG